MKQKKDQILSTTSTKFLIKNFPAGTKEVYIVGSGEALGNWLPEKAIKMQYCQTTTEPFFTVSIDLPSNTDVEYKYLNHPTWTNVECGLAAEELPNRHIILKATKTRKVIDEIKGFRI